MPREHGESGEFVETTTHADVLGVFDEVRGPVVLSADVADALECSRETARRKLEELHERGTLDRRKVARRVVYWPATRNESAAESRQDPAVTPTEAPVDQSDPTPDTPREDAPTPALDDALDGWVPDTEANPRTARTQTRRAAEWLRDAGEYRRAGEFKDALGDGSSLTPRVWWDRAVRPGLNHLADHGLVEYVKNRGYRWRDDSEE